MIFCNEMLHVKAFLSKVLDNFWFNKYEFFQKKRQFFLADTLFAPVTHWRVVTDKRFVTTNPVTTFGRGQIHYWSNGIFPYYDLISSSMNMVFQCIFACVLQCFFLNTFCGKKPTCISSLCEQMTFSVSTGSMDIMGCRLHPLWWYK